MARTTLVLDTNLLRRLKKKAAEEGRTLQAVANELLRRGLMEPAHPSYRLQWPSWQAVEQPGVNIFDRDSLLDLLDRSEREGG